MSARSLFMSLPSPTMMPERIGIIGSMQGVKASRSPKPKKLASTSQVLPDSNMAAMSVSLAEVEKRDEGATAGGALVMDGDDSAPKNDPESVPGAELAEARAIRGTWHW